MNRDLKQLPPTPNDLEIGDMVYRRLSEVTINKLVYYRRACMKMDNQQFFNAFVAGNESQCPVVWDMQYEKFYRISSYHVGYVCGPRVAVPLHGGRTGVGVAGEGVREYPGYRIRWERDSKETYGDVYEDGLVALKNIKIYGPEEFMAELDKRV